MPAALVPKVPGVLSTWCHKFQSIPAKLSTGCQSASRIKNLVQSACCKLFGSKVPAVFSTWCPSASCFQYLVPNCQLLSVPGAKVPAIFSTLCQSARQRPPRCWTHCRDGRRSHAPAPCSSSARRPRTCAHTAVLHTLLRMRGLVFAIYT